MILGINLPSLAERREMVVRCNEKEKLRQTRRLNYPYFRL